MGKTGLIVGVLVIAVIITLSVIFLPKKTEVPSNQTPELSLTQNRSANNLSKPETENLAMSKTYSKPPELQIDPNKSYSATVETSAGPLQINLFTSDTPNTVNNFIFLAKQDFYTGTKFHRIIKDFMIQGGDPKGDGTGDPGYKFNDEPITRDYTRGIIAMANSGPNTNGSQFFIMTKDTPLPKNYVIFGQLSGEESFSTLDAIASTPVTLSAGGEQSKPTSEVTITSVQIKEL